MLITLSFISKSKRLLCKHRKPPFPVVLSCLGHPCNTLLVKVQAAYLASTENHPPIRIFNQYPHECYDLLFFGSAHLHKSVNISIILKAVKTYIVHSRKFINQETFSKQYVRRPRPQGPLLKVINLFIYLFRT